MHDYSHSIKSQKSFSSFHVRHIATKRLFDIIFSFCILILGFPIFLIIGFLIALTSPGPIFYSHQRVGRAGKPIHCWKFRTMRKNSDKILHDLLQSSDCLKKEWLAFYKLKNDPRITPLGQFLRKTSLDELPQFWNVIRGDMSVVGPRPVVAEEIEKYYGSKSWKILSMRPGLTGIWQTSGRNQISMEERVKMEECYVETHSFLKDLKLICKTIPVMLFSKGAY